jgi:hypothetical protein
MVEKLIKLSVIVPFFNVERQVAENLVSLAQNASTRLCDAAGTARGTASRGREVFG